MEEGWERPPRLRLGLEAIERLVEPAFPGRRVERCEVLVHGLANTNLRFWLHGSTASYVLRLHTRELAAAAREREIVSYLAAHGAKIPVPRLVYSDPKPERGEHPYSIWEFVEGVLLQELFPVLHEPELNELAGACGRVLAELARYRFPRSGELGSGPAVVTDYGAPSEFVPRAVREALFEGRAGERLGAELRDALWQTVEREAPALSAIDGRYTLVHADYKRSNLLVRHSGSAWEVAAVLDWEFAFAGPPLVDVGLFLRAGSRLPPGFREAFAQGYRDGGAELPENWLALSRLVDLISQVTFLNSPEERPRIFAETREVVEETVRMLAGGTELAAR